MRRSSKPRSAAIVDAGDEPFLHRFFTGSRNFFCVHAGGGGVLAYRWLAKALAPSFSLWGIQVPGYDNGVGYSGHITELATRYLRAMRTHQPNGPYLIGGWSYGAVVAFEMAVQLIRAGEMVEKLVLFDAHLWDDIKLAAIPDEIIFGIFAQEFSLPVAEIKPFLPQIQAVPAARRIDACVELARDRNLLPAGMSPEEFRRRAMIFLNNVRSMRGYSPSRLNVPATLLRAREQVYDTVKEPLLSWETVLTGRLSFHDVPGSHYSMFHPPHVGTLGQKVLVELLDAS
jgi:thioesterase domain-containing protein